MAAGPHNQSINQPDKSILMSLGDFSMKLGYARVSTKDQNLNLQIDALKKEGCEKIKFIGISRR